MDNSEKRLLLHMRDNRDVLPSAIVSFVAGDDGVFIDVDATGFETQEDLAGTFLDLAAGLDPNFADLARAYYGARRLAGLDVDKPKPRGFNPRPTDPRKRS